MQSMTDKERDFETACAVSVKARNFTVSAKACPCKKVDRALLRLTSHDGREVYLCRH